MGLKFDSKKSLLYKVDMSKNRINQEYSPELFDQLNCQRVEDIEFYKTLVKYEGQTFLEIGCGTGRISIALAEAGANVTGIDISSKMLKRAKEKALHHNLSIDFICDDFKSASFSKKFSAIVFPFYTFSFLLTNEQILNFLETIKASLNDGGIFCFDIFNPKEIYLENMGDKRFLISEFNSVAGEKIRLEETREYDFKERVLHSRRFYSRKDSKDFYIHDLYMRVFSPEEIDNILEQVGLRVLHKYGDFKKNTFQKSSPEQIFICGV